METKNLLKEQLAKYYVDFDVAMGKGSGYFRQIENYTDKNREYFDFFKELYEKNHFLKVQPQEVPKIPKIIHQIWIGNREIPQKLQKYQQTWLQQNPGWEYKLWTNEEVKKYTFAIAELKFLFDQALTMGERVDVLRYDILYQYGGIYADLDCICLKSFDVFAYCYDFFTGICQPAFASMEPAIMLQNCLVGTKPKHPIIKKLSSLLLENWEDVEQKGDEIFTTVKRTLLTLTLTVIDEGGKYDNIDITMPPSYFLPIVPYPALDLIIRGFKDTFLGIFKKELSPYSSFKDYSFSNHYSHKEWMQDLYSTLSFKHKAWTVFNLKDWLLVLTSKLLHRKTQNKIGRQTFEELLSR